MSLSTVQCASGLHSRSDLELGGGRPRGANLLIAQMRL